MTTPKHIIRKQITCAKLQLIVLINKLDVEDWTDGDVNVQYEISRDRDIMAMLDLRLALGNKAVEGE